MLQHSHTSRLSRTHLVRMRNRESTMLQLSNVNTYYGPSHILQDISLEVNAGEIVCLLGANAAGKTTTMKTIFGLIHPTRGTIEFEGVRIDRKLPGDIVTSGLALVPEARRIFPRMTVLENLEMGAFIRNNRAEIKQDIDHVCEIGRASCRERV